MKPEPGPQIIEGTPSQLALIAGALAGAFDRALGTGTVWTVNVYMDMQRGKLTWDYIARFERWVKMNWPEGHGDPPTVEEIIGAPNSIPPLRQFLR